METVYKHLRYHYSSDYESGDDKSGLRCAPCYLWVMRVPIFPRANLTIRLEPDDG